MSNLALQEMDFAAPLIRRAEVQDRRRQVQALQGNEIAHIEIAQRSAGVTRNGVRPRPEQGLDCGPEFRQLERFLDELNRVRPVAFGMKFGWNAGRNREKTRIRISHGDPFEKFDRIGPGRIEIDDQKLGAYFGDARLCLRQGLDGANPMAGREFFQRRSDGGRERIVFFDEKNARRCPGMRFLGSRHGGSERKGRG